MPLLTAAATWDDYETAFVGLLGEARSHGARRPCSAISTFRGIANGRKTSAARLELNAELPLWQRDRMALLEECWAAGFEARIVVAREGVVDRSYLGRVLDRATALKNCCDGRRCVRRKRRIPHGGYCWAAVSPMKLELRGQVLRSGCWFQDVAVF